jgi:hypothetical protein
VNSTDGSLWFAHDGSALVAIDLRDARLRALWRTPMAHPRALGREANSLSVVLDGGETEVELWRYELPSLTLRVRQRVPVLADRAFMAVSGNGAVCTMTADGAVTLGANHTPAEPGPVTLIAAGYWFCSVHFGEQRSRCHFRDTPLARTRVLVNIDDISPYVIRLRDDVSTLCDAYGRVLAIDMRTGEVRRNLRVR